MSGYYIGILQGSLTSVAVALTSLVIAVVLGLLTQLLGYQNAGLRLSSPPFMPLSCEVSPSLF